MNFKPLKPTCAILQRPAKPLNTRCLLILRLWQTTNLVESIIQIPVSAPLT